jgi:hypothetical protein
MVCVFKVVNQFMILLFNITYSFYDGIQSGLKSNELGEDCLDPNFHFAATSSKIQDTCLNYRALQLLLYSRVAVRINGLIHIRPLQFLEHPKHSINASYYYCC